MTAVVSAAWAGPRRPRVSCTAGDLEWWHASGGPDASWPTRIRLWEQGGRLVAWAWLNPPASLDWFVADGVSAGDEAVVRTEILEWQAGVGREATASARAGDAHDAIQLETWAVDGWPEADVLRERGWTPTETILTQYLQALDLPLDPPRVP